MSSLGAIVMPIEPRPGWSPSWGDLRVGEVRRMLFDAREWAASRGVTVARFAAAADPLVLVMAGPLAFGGVCSFDLGADPAALPGSELRVVIDVGVAEDPLLDYRVVVRLTVRAAVGSGLVPLGGVSALLPGVLTDGEGALIDGDGPVTDAPAFEAPPAPPLTDAGGALIDATGPVIERTGL